MVHLLGYLVFEGYTWQRWALTAVVVLACIVPWPWPWVKWIGRGYRRVAARRWLAIGGVFVLSLIAVSALAIRRGLPIAYVHDESSYLLAADTFAHGRLTNPTPPCWEHFETMHVLLRPTYMSKYPPGQGLIMAGGQAVLGHPIVGIYVSTAMAAAAMVWMLMAFVPARWALLGGIMAAVHPQILEWGQRYWGGNLTVVGGCLLLGGAARIMWRKGGWGAAGVMGCGMAILANTRPYEGLVITLIILGVLLIRARKRWLTIIVSAGVVLVPVAIWMGYYNWRITGHPLRMPYMEYQRQYGTVPLFIFQELGPVPEYRHKELAKFHTTEQYYWYIRRESWEAMRDEAIKNIFGRLGGGAVGNVEVLILPLIVPTVWMKGRRFRLMMLALLLFTCALMLETYMIAHYAAPVAGLAAAIEVLALRELWREGWPGRFLVRLTVGVFLLWSSFWWYNFYHWTPDGFEYQRQHVYEELLRKPGKHLVVVRYGDHNVHQEWVYNEADIPAARVIWAREMDPASNRKLFECYSDRTAWLIEPDGEDKSIKPYSAP